nr:immunoglobulin heavy chain junction region [Mus musculus]
CARGKAWFAYW